MVLEYFNLLLKYMSDWRVLVGLIFTFLIVAFIYKKKDKIAGLMSFNFMGHKTSNAPNWKKILDALYNNTSENYKGVDNLSKDKEDKELSRFLINKGDELSSKIAFLLDQKLIGRNIASKNPYVNSLILTERGFELAEKNKWEKRKISFGVSIIFISAALLLVYTFNFIKGLEVVSKNVLLYLFLAGIFAFAFVFYRWFRPLLK